MDYEQERQEAYNAGLRALDSLKEARKQISGAKGFGLWDIFGGGTFVSTVKHYKIGKARRALERAKYDMQVFSQELQDVSMYLNVDIGDFLMLFDLMDNWFADVIVQSRLSATRNRIDEAISRVEYLLSYL